MSTGGILRKDGLELALTPAGKRRFSMQGDKLRLWASRLDDEKLGA